MLCRAFQFRPDVGADDAMRVQCESALPSNPGGRAMLTAIRRPARGVVASSFDWRGGATSRDVHLPLMCGSSGRKVGCCCSLHFRERRGSPKLAGKAPQPPSLEVGGLLSRPQLRILWSVKGRVTKKDEARNWGRPNSRSGQASHKPCRFADFARLVRPSRSKRLPCAASSTLCRHRLPSWPMQDTRPRAPGISSMASPASPLISHRNAVPKNRSASRKREPATPQFNLPLNGTQPSTGSSSATRRATARRARACCGASSARSAG
jgi:hypothetical protein